MDSIFLSTFFPYSHIDKKTQAIRFSLILFNYLIILFISSVIFHTTNRVCINFEAYKLLSSFPSAPLPPRTLILYTQILYLLMTGLILLRTWIRNLPEILNLLLVLADIILALSLLYYLNISDKGILLLAITNIMVFIINSRMKYSLLAICILLYIFIDFDILASPLRPYSFSNYLEYYETSTRITLFWIRNTLFSCTLVLFILFMIFEIQAYLEETTRVKELNKALIESTRQLKLKNIQLKELSKRSEEMAKLKERNRLASEIHDTIGHYLTAIDMGVKACIRAVDHDPRLLPSHLEKVNKLTNESLLDIRRSIKELRPDVLSRHDLPQAISGLAKEIADFSAVDVRCVIHGTEYGLIADIEELLYRVTQEGIANALRHSRTSYINIDLTYQNDGIKMHIQNDGAKSQKVEPGFGLTHISSKVNELSGHVNWEKTVCDEFILELFIPQVRRSK